MIDINFKNWFLINESFTLPYIKVKEIYEFIMEEKKRFDKYYKNDRSYELPEKSFPLDLYNTQFEFLYNMDGEFNKNKLDTNKFYVICKIENENNENDPCGWFYDDVKQSRDRNLTSKYHMNIHINFGQECPNDGIYKTLVHELLHGIQSLITLYKKKQLERNMKKNLGFLITNNFLNKQQADDILNYALQNDIKLSSPFGKQLLKYYNMIYYANAELLSKDALLKKGDMGYPTAYLFDQLEKLRPNLMKRLKANVQKLGDPRYAYAAYRHESQGGLPPKKLTQSLMKKFGINTRGNIKDKYGKIDHEKRPVEYYTNLSNLILHLQKGYIERVVTRQYNRYTPNIRLLNYERESKKKYFIDAMKNTARKKQFLFDYIHSKGWHIKKVEFDDSLYKKYLAECYKQFVSNHKFASDLLPSLQIVYNILRPIEQETYQQGDIIDTPYGSFNYSDFNGSVSINSKEIQDYFESNIDDSRKSRAKELFNGILKNHFNIQNGKYKTTLNYYKFKSLFREIADGARLNQYDSTGTKDYERMFDYLALKLLQKFQKQLKIPIPVEMLGKLFYRTKNDMRNESPYKKELYG